MSEAPAQAPPPTFRQVLPQLAGKDWFVVPLSRVGDALDNALTGRRAGDAGELTSMTARDPRDTGVRGGYPQINRGLPGQEALLAQFVRLAYKRSAPARILVDRIASDVWGEWVDLQSDDKALKDVLEAVCKNPTGRPGDRPLWWWIERAYRLARRDGRALLHFSLQDGNARTPNLVPLNVQGIRGLTIIRQENIQEAIVGRDPAKPEEFGRILGWRVLLNQSGPLGVAGEAATVHADRVQAFIPYPTEDDLNNGESILAQNINYVEMLENLVWANAEAYFQEAVPFVVVILDKDVQLDPDEKAEAKRQVANMQQSLTQRIFLKGVTVQVLQGSGQLANPMPHFEIALRMFAMSLGGFPKSLLTGDSAGDLSASKEDTRRAQAIVSKIQEQDADPSLYAIIAKFIAWDVAVWGKREPSPVTIKWRPIFEGDPGEEATRQQALMQARTGYRNARLPLPEELDYDPVGWPEGTEDHPAPQLPFGQTGQQDGGAPPFGQGPAKPGQPQDQAGDAGSRLDPMLARFRARILAALKPAWEAAAAAAHAPIKRAGDTVTGFMVEVDNAEARDRLSKALEDAWVEALSIGGQAMLAGLPTRAVYNHLHSPSLGQIRTLAPKQASDTLERLSKRLREVVADGVAHGASGQDLAKRIMDNFDATRVDAERLARSEGIYAYNQGAQEAMQAAGIARYTWDAFADADDGSSDGVCALLDGQEFQVGAGPLPVRDTHPNCRCAIVPVLP